MHNNKNKGTIFYMCYDHQIPTGGQKQMYRHVDILNANGFTAYAVHRDEKFRLKWFENNTKVKSLDEVGIIFDENNDFIVLPEDNYLGFIRLPGKKIIFNQGIFSSFKYFNYNLDAVKCYINDDIKYIMTVSQHNYDYFNFILPNKKIRRIYNAVDDNTFEFKKILDKKKEILILPNKSKLDLKFIFHSLQIRSFQKLNIIQKFSWKFFNNLNAKDAAKALSDALIIIFPNTFEGFTLTLLEAMLSGTIVISFKGGPNLEFLNKNNSFLIDAYNHLEFIKRIEKTIDLFENNCFDELEFITKNAFLSASQFSLQKEKESILSFWDEVFKEK